MSWSFSDGGVISSSDTGTANQSVRHSIRFDARAEHHGKSVLCRTFFATPLDPLSGENEATNVPDFEDMFESAEIMVQGEKLKEKCTFNYKKCIHVLRVHLGFMN